MVLFLYALSAVPLPPPIIKYLPYIFPIVPILIYSPRCYQNYCSKIPFWLTSKIHLNINFRWYLSNYRIKKNSSAGKFKLLTHAYSSIIIVHQFLMLFSYSTHKRMSTDQITCILKEMAQDGYCSNLNCIPIFPQLGLKQILSKSLKSKAYHYALENNILSHRDVWLCKKGYSFSMIYASVH